MSDWRKAADDLAATGLHSWREIAKLIGKPKSTVSDYLRASQPKPQGPNIGVIDIETAPTKAWIWNRWKENIGQDQVEEEGYILCAAIKPLGDPNVEFKATWETGDVEDDAAVTHWLHERMSAYDILIAHNGDKFDLPTINARCAYHGLTPPAPYKSIDTLKILKKRFRLPSNSLNSAAAYFKLGSKVPHSGFDLWTGTMAGDKEAQALMAKYNIHDVVLLEELYNLIAAWDPAVPSVAIRTDDSVVRCNCCGGKHVVPHDNKYYTSVSAFQLYQCGDCGHWMRGRTNTLTKEQRASALVSVK